MLWLSFFADAQVYVGKLMHIWCGQGQQELDELGVKITTISCMTGHSKETGNKSVATPSCHLHHAVAAAPPWLC
jgi:hypothetical protein